jgi:hypothetical protein
MSTEGATRFKAWGEAKRSPRNGLRQGFVGQADLPDDTLAKSNTPKRRYRFLFGCGYAALRVTAVSSRVNTGRRINHEIYYEWVRDRPRQIGHN